MKIGYDVSQTGAKKAGCGFFADSLLRALAKIDKDNQYILYPTFGDGFWDPEWKSTTCQIAQPNFKRGLSYRFHKDNQHFWTHPSSDFEKQLGHPDIIHANNFFCPTHLRSANIVYTLHDMSFLENPEWTTEANRTTCFNGVFNASLHADWIIAVSEYTKKHFMKTFPHYPAEQISVIYHASRFTYNSNLTRPKTLSMLYSEMFWLTVGTIEPRKNYYRLLKSYASLKNDTEHMLPLVIAGKKGWLNENFEQWIIELNLEADVVWMDYVNDIELQWLYQNCFTFIYPSLFEGFGMPVVEAMSLGAVVLTSNVTALPEIIKEAEQLFDPLDTLSISNKMRQVYQDDNFRKKAKMYSLSRSSDFSWEKSAKLVLECYNQVNTF